MLDFLRHRPYSIRTKLLVAVMFVVLVPLLGTAFYGNWFTGQVIKTQTITASYNQLARRVQQIETYLSGNKSDIRYLSHIYSLNQYITAAQDQNVTAQEYWRRQLEQDFLIFSSAHPDYYQVRYLDATGQEIARVDTFQGRTYIIPRDQLQNKSQRYYFIEGSHLPPGDIYISPLDLNREHGQLEQPLHPVIRYVTPVYRDDQFWGVIVINMEGKAILRFVQPSGNLDAQVIMVDQDGYYLMHPDEAKRWGGPNDLNTGYSVRQDFPQSASSILSGRAGDVTEGGRVIIFTPVHYAANDPQRFWVLMQVEPVNQLLMPLFDFRLTAGFILIAAIILALLMTYIVAENFTRPVLALQQGVQRLSQGHFAEQLPVYDQDEIGQLTQAFNEMAGLIRGYLDQMDRLQQLGLQLSSHVERDAILSMIMDTLQDILPVRDIVVYCLQVQGDNEVAYQVVSSVPSSLPSDRPPLDWDAMMAASQRQIGEVLPQTRGQQALCYAPLRISASRRAVVELVGHGPDVLDPWHCKLLSSLMAQGSIALENADLYQRLAHHRQQLQQLVSALITAQEEERRMVAYDIHDGLLQYLVAARLLLRNYAAMAARDPEASDHLLKDGMEQLATAIHEGRRIIEGMRPTLLDDLGLEAAVREIATDMAQRAHWDLELDMQMGDHPLAPETEIAAFRIIQEALTNAYKYAKGQRVLVRLAIEDDTLSILVRDWGEGFDLVEVDSGYGHVGLVAMQERARLVGGVCTIQSRPGQGVQVHVRLPLNLHQGALHSDDDSRDHC